MVRLTKSIVFESGAEALSYVEAAISAGSKEPAPRTKDPGLPPVEIETIYEMSSSNWQLVRVIPRPVRRIFFLLCIHILPVHKGSDEWLPMQLLKSQASACSECVLFLKGGAECSTDDFDCFGLWF